MAAQLRKLAFENTKLNAKLQGKLQSQLSAASAPEGGADIAAVGRVGAAREAGSGGAGGGEGEGEGDGQGLIDMPTLDRIHLAILQPTSQVCVRACVRVCVCVCVRVCDARFPQS